MPTANPRISVTLTPEVAAVLRRVCDLAEKSQSAFVAELLTASIPVFERMAALLEAAHTAKEGLRDEMAESLTRAQDKLEAQLGLALDTMDEGMRPVLEVAETVKRRRARTSVGGTRLRGDTRSEGVAGGGSTPVPVTRGSGHPKPTTQPTHKGKTRGRV